MFSRFRKAALLAAFVPVSVYPPRPTLSAQRSAPSAQRPTPRALRVCADPNNLPFSNDRQEGFENQIAALIARDLGVEVEYTWWPQRRGFVRNTLNERLCDVVIGVPAHLDMLLTTKPYYRSAYVFVTRRDRHLDIRSFDDRRLRKLRIGVPVVGDDYAGTPPMHALARRGLLEQLVGYSVYGDYGTPNPPLRLVQAVAEGSIDVGVAWGPLAGFVARRSSVPLVMTPVDPPADLRAVPFAYDIAMGVRRGDRAMRARLDSVIVRRRPAIDSVLAAYGVPRVTKPAAASTEGR
jgi:quinoprotein dehydrogenase-associated probable ABC transporter substrate-binding protein